MAHVLYLVFTEGHTATAGGGLTDVSLAAEAIRLTRRLHHLLPADSEVTGLLALMLLTDARRPARLDEAGALVPLAEQDRSRWDHDLIAEGVALVEAALPSGPVGPYQLQAAIAAVHAEAATAADTDWAQVEVLYGMLAELTPGPVVTLNHAVAVAETRGPEAALAMVEPLLDEPSLRRTHRLHAVRAHLLERAGRADEARAAYAEAARLATSIPEQRYLQARIDYRTVRPSSSGSAVGWGVRAPVREAPTPAATTNPTPAAARALGTWCSTTRPTTSANAGSRLIKRPERRRGEPAQGEQLERERDDRQQQREPDSDKEQLGGQPAEGARAGHHGGGQAGHRHGHGECLDAFDAVADVLREQDVRRPAQARGQREADTDRVDRALPRLGEHQHAHRCESRPDPGVALAPGDGDAERAEELQRAGRAQRQPLQGGHEEHRQAGRDQAQHDARGERTLREVGASRPHHHEQQHPCPGQPEPGGALGAELVDEPHRRRQAELDAEHRRDRHGGADASAGAVHASIEPDQTVHFHV